MVPSIVVLGTQIMNNKMRSSKLIIKSTTQKVMAKSSFGRRLHNLKSFEVGVFDIPLIYCILEGTTTKICRKTSIYCNFIMF